MIKEKMGLVEFMERFGTEESCREYMYQMKWPEGFVCPKCKEKDEPFNIKSHNRYQCRHCNHQTTVTAGTIMEKSRTPLTKWFLAMYLMGQDKRGCSALRLKSELGIAYDTAWTMSHKIRKAMGERNAMYLLSGTVDLDDGFFGGAHEGSKRGRGTDKTTVLVGVSFNDKNKCQYIKAKIVPNVKKETLKTFINENVLPDTELRSDAFRSYKGLKKEFPIEITAYDPNQNPEHLKWLHVIVSNVKRFILGTYHGLDDTHLQLYLDEFVFRFNRRYMQGCLFNRIINACVNSSVFTRYDLIG